MGSGRLGGDCLRVVCILLVLATRAERRCEDDRSLPCLASRSRDRERLKSKEEFKKLSVKCSAPSVIAIRAGGSVGWTTSVPTAAVSRDDSASTASWMPPAAAGLSSPREYSLVELAVEVGSADDSLDRALDLLLAVVSRRAERLLDRRRVEGIC